MGPSHESLSLLLDFLRDLRARVRDAADVRVFGDFERIHLDFLVEAITVRLEYAPMTLPNVLVLRGSFACEPVRLALDDVTPDALAMAMARTAARAARISRVEEPTLP